MIIMRLTQNQWQTEVENPQIFGNNLEINKNVLMKKSLKIDV